MTSPLERIDAQLLQEQEKPVRIVRIQLNEVVTLQIVHDDGVVEIPGYVQGVEFHPCECRRDPVTGMYDWAELPRLVMDFVGVPPRVFRGLPDVEGDKHE